MSKYNNIYDVNEWSAEVIEMKAQGFSTRHIARSLFDKESYRNRLNKYFKREDVIDEIPDNFQFSEIVDEELKKNNWFGYMNGNYHNADEKLLMDGEYRVFEDQMYGAVNSIFQFYANDEFPAIWEKVLQVYLHDGFPCGWEGDRENGRIVVFSNY